jgi:hypothetical protein
VCIGSIVPLCSKEEKHADAHRLLGLGLCLWSFFGRVCQGKIG